MEKNNEKSVQAMARVSLFRHDSINRIIADSINTEEYSPADLEAAWSIVQKIATEGQIHLPDDLTDQEKIDLIRSMVASRLRNSTKNINK